MTSIDNSATLTVEVKRPMRTQGTGTLYKKYKEDGVTPISKYWYIGYMDANKRQRHESTRTESRQEAEVLLGKRIAEVNSGRTVVNSGSVTYEMIRALIIQDYERKQYKTLVNYGGEPTLACLPSLDAFFENWRVSQITTQALQRFVERRKLEGAANGTINRSLSALRRMFTLAVQQRLIDRNHTPTFYPSQKEAEPRQGFIEREDFAHLIDALAPRMRPLVRFLYETACRLGAAQQLLWDWVDLDKREVHIPGSATKNGEPLMLPLTAEMVEVLRSMPTKYGQEKYGHVFDTTNFRKLWQDAVDTAKLGHLRKDGHYDLLIHDLRRSGVRNLRKAGVPEGTIMKISGHKTRTVFDRYNIVDASDLHEAMAKLEDSKPLSFAFSVGGVNVPVVGTVTK